MGIMGTKAVKHHKSYEDLVREKLVESGLTSSALNERTGLHPTTIRRFRTGKLHLRIENLEKLARELGVAAALVTA